MIKTTYSLCLKDLREIINFYFKEKYNSKIDDCEITFNNLTDNSNISTHPFIEVTVKTK